MPRSRPRPVRWDELPPDVVINLNDRLLSLQKPMADDWFKLGKKLLTMPGGRSGRRARLCQGMHFDPKMKDQIVSGPQNGERSVKPVRPTPAGLNGKSDTANSGATTQPSNPFDPRDPNKHIVGPQEKGAMTPALG